MLKAAIVLLVVAVVAVSAHPKWHQLEGYTFTQYVSDFGKKYTEAEYPLREKLFAQRLAEVKQHNSETHSWKKGVNHLTDTTDVERQMMNGGKAVSMGQLGNKELQKSYVSKNGGQLPRKIDHRLAIPPVLTAVKDQGRCGSCWAHGSTETMESMWAISTGELFVLSQQEITACAPNVNECGGTGGCMGSTAELAYEYAALHGLTQEWNYPYTAYNGTTGQCKPNAGKSEITVTSYTKLPKNDQYAVMEALATVGPLAINVDASHWFEYESGVYSGCNFAMNISIDHVVQLVGYDTDLDSGLDYWIVRNSWSPTFGESGYIRVLRNKDTPECGWCVDPQDGTGCKGGPKQLWTCGMCGILYDVSYPNVRS